MKRKFVEGNVRGEEYSDTGRVNVYLALTTHVMIIVLCIREWP
jgi:hypothetical protein